MTTHFEGADSASGGYVTAVIGAVIAGAVMWMIPGRTETRLMLGSGVLVVIAVLMRICTRQDIIDVYPTSKRIRTCRRRAFGPDTVREYGANQVIRVVASRIVDESGSESYMLEVRMSDSRAYDFGSANLVSDAVSRGMQLLAATGRADLKIYVKSHPMQRLSEAQQV